jgi:hypothetical protein
MTFAIWLILAAILVVLVVENRGHRMGMLIAVLAFAVGYRFSHYWPVAAAFLHLPR